MTPTDPGGHVERLAADETTLETAQANADAANAAADSANAAFDAAEAVVQADIAAVVADFVPPPPPPPPPDHGINLRADSVAVTGPNQVGSASVLAATFTNTGDTPTTSGVAIGVGFFDGISGAQLAWVSTLTPLAAGAQTTLSTDMAPSSTLFKSPAYVPALAGLVNVVAKVDDVNRLAEVNETDNTVATTVTIAAAPTPPPPPPPNGTSYPGPSGPVLLKVRRPDQWGFDQLAACNLPFGNEAAFGSVAPAFGSLFWFLWVDHWGLTINRAEPNATTDEVGQVYIAGDDENHQSFTLTDGLTAYDGYGAISQTNRAPAQVSAHYSLKQPVTADNHGGMVYTNMGACGWSHQIGIITEADVLQGYIGHTLSMALNGGNLSLTTPFVDPAYRADANYKNDYKGGARNVMTGPWAIGDRFGIPWAAPALGCTSRVGKLMEQGLRTHGAYLDNFAGNGGFKGESTAQMLAWRTELMASGDPARIVAAIRACTNASPSAYAGPAISGRRAPLAPAWAY